MGVGAFGGMPGMGAMGSVVSGAGSIASRNHAAMQLLKKRGGSGIPPKEPDQDQEPEKPKKKNWFIRLWNAYLRMIGVKDQY